ncbi:MAG: hypothetical protein ACO32E_02525, partial [Ilumatobacteraceae bacterium]
TTDPAGDAPLLVAAAGLAFLSDLSSFWIVASRWGSSPAGTLSAAADAALAPSVAFMLGKLKATGPTGPLFDALSSGDAARRIAELVAND